jgi:hypothetical protein
MGFALVIWSGRRDSNSRPLAPHEIGDGGVGLLGWGFGIGVCRGRVCLLGCFWRRFLSLWRR